MRELLAARDAKAFIAAENGRIVLEHYAEGLDSGTLFNSYSLVKSLVGALVLKAVAEGRIKSLSEPLGTHLPAVGDAALRAVPLEAFLTMRSGVLFEAGSAKAVSGTPAKDLEASFANPFGPLVKLHMLGLEKVAAGLTADADAIGRFSYQNINTAILGAVLEKAYDQPLGEILAAKIWRPSGAAPARWRRHARNRSVTAYCCLYARARDWFRVAQFLNRNGSPNAPFLSTELWRSLMGAEFTEEELHKGQYGRHVRHDILDRGGQELQGGFTYFLGRGGQIVYLMPQTGSRRRAFRRRPAAVAFDPLRHLENAASFRVMRGGYLQITPSARKASISSAPYPKLAEHFVGMLAEHRRRRGDTAPCLRQVDRQIRHRDALPVEGNLLVEIDRANLRMFQRFTRREHRAARNAGSAELLEEFLGAASRHTRPEPGRTIRRD